MCPVNALIGLANKDTSSFEGHVTRDDFTHKVNEIKLNKEACHKQTFLFLIHSHSLLIELKNIIR